MKSTVHRQAERCLKFDFHPDMNPDVTSFPDQWGLCSLTLSYPQCIGSREVEAFWLKTPIEQLINAMYFAGASLVQSPR